MKVSLIFLCVLIILGCEIQEENGIMMEQKIANYRNQPVDSTSCLPCSSIANEFDFPVGPPDAEGYYNAQEFGKNNHLGDDWNGNAGGNSDLGAPVYAIANGSVVSAKNEGYNWGNVIRIVHCLSETEKVESIYAHCDTILITAGSDVLKGQQIGTIGTANGCYPAHLHFEIRERVGMPLGPGYSSNSSGYLDPSEFLKKHRKN